MVFGIIKIAVFFVNNKKNKCEWCERLQNILRAKKSYK